MKKPITLLEIMIIVGILACAIGLHACVSWLQYGDADCAFKTCAKAVR